MRAGVAGSGNAIVILDMLSAVNRMVANDLELMPE